MKCPRCYYPDADMTDWRPKSGLEPYLREFVCDNCGARWYQVIKTPKVIRREALIKSDVRFKGLDCDC